MNFSKEQKDYIIHALEHCEVLTGGRSSGKTLELIKQQEKEIERLNNIINELEKYLIEEIEDYDKAIKSQYTTGITREQYEGEKVCFEDTLGKLQELKGSGNND